MDMQHQVNKQDLNRFECGRAWLALPQSFPVGRSRDTPEQPL